MWYGATAYDGEDEEPHSKHRKDICLTHYARITHVYSILWQIAKFRCQPYTAFAFEPHHQTIYMVDENAETPTKHFECFAFEQHFAQRCTHYLSYFAISCVNAVLVRARCAVGGMYAYGAMLCIVYVLCAFTANFKSTFVFDSLSSYLTL